MITNNNEPWEAPRQLQRAKYSVIEELSSGKLLKLNRETMNQNDFSIVCKIRERTTDTCKANVQKKFVCEQQIRMATDGTVGFGGGLG